LKEKTPFVFEQNGLSAGRTGVNVPEEKISGNGEKKIGGISKKGLKRRKHRCLIKKKKKQANKGGLVRQPRN